MIIQQDGASSPLATKFQFLHHVTSRRPRVYVLVGIAFLLVTVAVWTYGGLATGIDFITSLPHPADLLHHTTTNSTEAPTDNDWRHSKQRPVNAVGIPNKIWQILLPKKSSSEPFVANPKSLEDTPTWLALNPDYTYTLVGQKGGDEFVENNFGHEPRIVEAYRKMPNVGMKSDLLRYLLLWAQGGVYTDTDTVALKPIDVWVPEEMRDEVAVVVGIEFDRRDGPPWADILHWVQFCQWTIAAAPGHPVFGKMVHRVLDALDDLSAAHGVPIDQLKPSSFEVMNSTGPAAWSEVVFKQLQEYDTSLKEHKDLSFMTEPKLVGNILILTIDGFGMGQPHSNSTNDGTIPEAALVKHLFKGGWRGDAKRRRWIYEDYDLI
ncbi:hypothetical protein VTJ49DRAFT_6610 [Mycothermus thermophilus]|uniref:Alpha-1,6-mannosyltransferase n=1 Tax=Humicola insolens TaxID=85995 RepID=A0ABR3VJK0_HUMIN